MSSVDLKRLIDAGEADPVTESQRVAAARIRVISDQKRGIATEPWIEKLAQGR